MIASKSHYTIIGLIGFILFLGTNIDAKSQSGSLFYVKTELISESNIFEDSTETRSLGTNIWLGMAHDFRSPRHNLQLKMLSNLVSYNHHNVENKAVNLLALQYQFSLLKSLALIISAESFNKQWYRSAGGYSNRLISCGLNVSTQNTTFNLGGDYRYNLFPSYPQFTSDYRGIFLHINHQSTTRTFLSGTISLQSIRYPERWIPGSNDTVPGASAFQSDQLLTVQMGSEFRNRFIFGAYLRYMVNSSNNPSASYQATSCRLMSSQKILGFYTQLIVDLQLKDYTDELDQFRIPVNPDPEQNIQNQLMFGWDRPLNDRLSLQGKFAYIKTETALSNRYYDKWFVTAGLMYTF